jgi:hypothetical protein
MSEPTTAATEFIRDLAESPEYCTYCFTHVRTHAAGHDDTEAWTLSVGPTAEAFYAQGHRLDEDGVEEPATNTYDPVPAATLTHTPDGDRVLFCPNCDRETDAGTEPGEHRDTSTLVDHLENVLDVLDVDGDRGAARDALIDAATDPDLAHADHRTLAVGLDAAVDNAYE